jgi:hypothetical protein
MPQMCKKHNKPRTVIYEKKMPRGGLFSIVGCEDCAEAARSANSEPMPKLTPKKKPKAARSQRREL